MSRQIQILNRTTCSNFTNEDWRYFLYNLLYYKQNINLFLPEHYANIADVLLVKIQLNLIKNSYILNINIQTSDGRYYRKSIEIIDTYKSIDTFDTRKKYR